VRADIPRRYFDQVLERRAMELATFLKPHLPSSGQILDIGSGTGHNAQALRRLTALECVETDVVDMSVRRHGTPDPEPILFDGAQLPFADDTFACSYMLFVLHYAQEPVRLLREARRITRGPVLVLQSVYRGCSGLVALRANDVVWGPLAFGLARASGLIDPVSCPLRAQQYFTRVLMGDIFEQAGFGGMRQEPGPWPRALIERELFILER
jgi:SAM-dependent methyltransferase